MAVPVFTNPDSEPPVATPPVSIKPAPWQQKAGSRTAGRVWVLVLLVCLTAINYGASSVVSFLGTFAWLYDASLIISTSWIVVLLAAVWVGYNWARFVLSIFLICFLITEGVLIQRATDYYINLNDEGVWVIALQSVTYALAAIYLVFSSDIRWLCRPPQEPLG